MKNRVIKLIYVILLVSIISTLALISNKKSQSIVTKNEKVNYFDLSSSNKVSEKNKSTPLLDTHDFEVMNKVDSIYLDIPILQKIFTELDSKHKMSALMSAAHKMNNEELKKNIDYFNSLFNDKEVIYSLNQNKLSANTVTKLEHLMLIKTKFESILLFRLVKSL